MSSATSPGIGQTLWITRPSNAGRLPRATQLLHDLIQWIGWQLQPLQRVVQGKKVLESWKQKQGSHSNLLNGTAMVPEVIYSIHPGCQPDEGHFFCRNQHVLTVQFLSFGSLRARGSDVSEDAKLLSLRFLDSLITTSR